jgi:Insect cuticle protein
VKHGAEGTIQQVGTESILSVKGSYSYTAPDGQVITVNYIADQNGFQPDNLPKGP